MRILIAVAVTVVVLLLGLTVWIFHRPIDERWQACGVGDREVRSIAIDADGKVYAAANRQSSGDVLVSGDHCMHFEPWGLKTEVVWSVSWLREHQLLCAGLRSGMRCSSRGEVQSMLTSPEIYWAVETRSGIVAGGYPTVVYAPTDAKFGVALKPGYAASDGAAIEDRVYVATRGLYVSDDGGASYTPTSFTSISSVVAGRGDRVYVGGGTFGGFFAGSDDRGRSFHPLTLPGSQPERILLPLADPDIVLVGTHGDFRAGGLHLSKDGGRAWINLGCPGSEIHAIAIDEAYVYCGATALLGTDGMWRIPRSVVGL